MLRVKKGCENGIILNDIDIADSKKYQNRRSAMGTKGRKNVKKPKQNKEKKK
jgi:hypothetical protein